ncbi:MAG: Flp family type IVb pilin [Hyphomonas sp.]|nr:Flp family type IVb pilin [Hyphomonas sp.]
MNTETHLRTFKSLLADESGASAVEYGMIAALMVVGILAAITNFAMANDGNYKLIEDNLV